MLCPSQNLRDGLSGPLSTGSAPLCCPGEQEDLFFLVLMVMKVERRRASFFHPHYHMAEERGTTFSLILMGSGPACLCPGEQSQCCCTAQMTCRVLSPECFTQ